MTKGRVLVTGASGFVASHVVKLLLEHGYRVRGTVRSLTNATKIEPIMELCPDRRQYLELIEADLLQVDVWRQAVRGCDYVVHVASPLPASVGDHNNSNNRDDVIKPAVDGTLNVLRAAQAEGVKKVVVTSSSLAVYDSIRAEPDNNRVHDESEWTQVGANHHKRWAYVESKVRAERAAWDFYNAQPKRARFAPTTILPTAIIGPVLHGAPAGHTQQIIETLVNRRPAYAPNFGLELCDVRDVALAHLRALELLRETDGLRILVHTRSVWMIEIVDILRHEFEPLGYRLSTRKAPKLLAKFGLAMMNSQLRAMSRRLNRQALFNNTRMRTVLDIEPPTPVDKSLIDMTHTMIQRGDVRMTSRYAEWLLRHPESNYFQQDALTINKRVAESSSGSVNTTTSSSTNRYASSDVNNNNYSSKQSEIYTAGVHDDLHAAGSSSQQSHPYTTEKQRRILTPVQIEVEEIQMQQQQTYEEEDARNIAGPSSRVSSRASEPRRRVEVASPVPATTTVTTTTTTRRVDERFVVEPPAPRQTLFTSTSAARISSPQRIVRIDDIPSEVTL